MAWMEEHVASVVPGVLTLSSGAGHRAGDVRMNGLVARLTPCDTTPLAFLAVTIGAQESFVTLEMAISQLVLEVRQRMLR